MNVQPTNLPRVTYSNTGEDFSGVHAHLDEVIPSAESRLLGKIRPSLVGGRDRMEGCLLTACSPIDRHIVLGEFPQADGALVDEAVEVARRAFPSWRDRGWRRRVELLRKAADVLEERKWDISIACLIEVGKSRLEAVGEVEEAIDLVRHYCSEIERTDGFSEQKTSTSSIEKCTVVLRPYGVFAVISPFNFPVALAIGMISAALVAGNTVVFKPSEVAGLTGRLVVEALVAGGVPDGVVNLVHGGDETGSALVRHGLVDAIAFTSSNMVERRCVQCSPRWEARILPSSAQVQTLRLQLPE
jgi:1-pyrroline-5-carboxylate dehydrogenase